MATRSLKINTEKALRYGRLAANQAASVYAYGEAANLSRESDRALEYFQKAMEVSTNMPDRPEIALTRFDMAELILGHFPSQRDEAMEHLELAIAEFEDMKMQPSLERARAVKVEAQSQPYRRPAYPDGLTEREVEVLRLVASGMTDREIAGELFIAIGTASTHVRNILSKTDTTNRAEAASYANRHNLI